MFIHVPSLGQLSAGLSLCAQQMLKPTIRSFEILTPRALDCGRNALRVAKLCPNP